MITFTVLVKWGARPPPEGIIGAKKYWKIEEGKEGKN
jgi:hypothetical protein